MSVTTRLRTSTRQALGPERSSRRCGSAPGAPSSKSSADSCKPRRTQTTGIVKSSRRPWSESVSCGLTRAKKPSGSNEHASATGPRSGFVQPAFCVHARGHAPRTEATSHPAPTHAKRYPITRTREDVRSAFGLAVPTQRAPCEGERPAGAADSLASSRWRSRRSMLRRVALQGHGAPTP